MKSAFEQKIQRLETSAQTGQLTKKQKRKLKKLKKKFTEDKEKQREKIFALAKKIFLALLLMIIATGAYKYFSTRKYLPPTDLAGHIEKNPPSHILNEPMPENIQKHMLEHADGQGKPGIIIQYNCKDFECEPDLAEKLTQIVKKYPDHVYLAPNNYNGKIILTKTDKIKILDSFDQEAIKEFIEQ